MVTSVVINIFINMQRTSGSVAEIDDTDTLTDGSSFSDRDGVVIGGGPADDIIPQGRVYCYSSDEDDDENVIKTIPLHQRIKRSRFVSRIQEERVQIQSEKLDMEQFQPMMTSEKMDSTRYKATEMTESTAKYTNNTSGARTRRPRNKRECATLDNYYDESSRYLRKRERKESDYGSLSTLDSSMLKLDIIEQEPKLEVILANLFPLIKINSVLV